MQTEPNPALASQELVFNVADRPELLEAITSRLEELGFTKSLYATTGGATNVSVGLCDNGIYSIGVFSVESTIYSDFRLTTLEDLYDIESWCPQPVEEEEEETGYTGPVGRFQIGDNPALCEAIQKRLFELGAEWGFGDTGFQYLDAAVIWVNKNGVLTYVDQSVPYHKSTWNDNTPLTLTDLYS